MNEIVRISLSDIVRIPFLGGEVLAVDWNGKRWVVFKPIVEDLGLSYATQHNKLRRASWASMFLVNMQLSDQHSYRDHTLVDLRTLSMWLARIEESRVGRDVRDRLIEYQAKVADVIEAHFAGRVLPAHQLPQTYGQALLELAESELNLERQHQQLAIAAGALEQVRGQLAIAQPKVDAFEAWLASENDDELTVTKMAAVLAQEKVLVDSYGVVIDKHIKRALFAKIRGLKWQVTDGRRWVLGEKARRLGYMWESMHQRDRSGNDYGTSTCLFTRAGAVEIRRIYLGIKSNPLIQLHSLPVQPPPRLQIMPGEPFTPITLTDRL